MSESRDTFGRAGAILLAAAMLVCPARAARAQLTPPPAGEPTPCMDHGMNITFATAVGVDNRGYTYVTGGKRLNDEASGASRGSAFVTIKYSPDGDEVWSRSYQDAFGCFDHARALATDRAGNVYVTGTVWLAGNNSAGSSVDQPRRAYATIKYDANGTLQWAARYLIDGDQKNEPLAIALDHHGGVWGVVNSWYLTNMYTADGDLLWTRDF